MFEKYLWKSGILSKDAGNYLPGFYMSGTLVENGLNLLYEIVGINMLTTLLHFKFSFLTIPL